MSESKPLNTKSQERLNITIGRGIRLATDGVKTSITGCDTKTKGA